ncbi:hypothetical protein, partial [Stenotrophomonas maltophilia]|uniref:hypothetical protein n=1 Tax=Stenotrophomonas maltophilia TaxID=40324 RepID=UPI0019536726
MAYRRHNAHALLQLLILTVALAIGGTPAFAQPSQGNTPVTLDQIKQAQLGHWTSIAPEIRPSALKNA